MDQVQSLYLVRWDLEGGQQKERKVIKVIKATLGRAFQMAVEKHIPCQNAAFVT